ncbi:recQ-mediated genome instability protein 1 [Selaginella moellendorffii]|uniref:recQ-mediated genome instability protein 1 n=1 Tax=Selaginella moellendorffii TaxID=88036 RepID=UPI000D1CF7B2|nr:recQ-mediated genome instability protein 1 [Selaginella moellendorffii]|eukprot:XP_024537331.1 recQ-mediated genome instability protein 1 [Selaginella moellendorffii]
MEERVVEIMASRGMRPKAQGLSSCLREQIGASQLPVDLCAEKCFAQLLAADFNLVTDAVLPPGVQAMHKVELAGPFVLQVDETVDICCGLKDRYQERNAGIGSRCLKLSMTDGAQRVFGIEYRPIPQLKVLQPAGLKICVRNVCIRRGMFLLVPEIVTVLGGVVQELEEARQRVVHQVNKPPRGNRHPRGTTPPSLEEQLTQAAWPRTPDVQENNGAAANPGSEQQPSSTVRDHPYTGRQAPVSIEDFSRGSYSYSEQTPRQDETTHRTLSGTPSETSIGLGTSRIRMLSLQSNETRSRRQLRTADSLESPPFTYLAVLQRRFMESGVVQSGRVKCFLTAVKEFLFKDRNAYRLAIYIEDGSLLTEALVNHELVERMIGHSPLEVSAAIASNEHARMKSKMRELQAFLKRYQGYMNIEFGDIVRVVAVNDLHASGDGWTLLARVEAQSSSSMEMDLFNIN